MKPLSNIHLQPSIHLSEVSVGSATIRTKSLRSLRDFGPEADSENTTDVRAAAAMCQFAYYYLNLHLTVRKPKADLIDGWRPMAPNEVDRLVFPGFNGSLKEDRSGFSSMLFTKKVDGIPYYAYCTEGTGIKSIRDWKNNVTQFINGKSRQYDYSVQRAKLLDLAVGDEGVLWFIGHSLGGGLASNNSLVTGRHAITFNAAGLNTNRIVDALNSNNPADLLTPIERTRRIHAFVLEGEVLNTALRLFDQEAFGDRKVIKYNNKNVGSFGRHGMTTILDALGLNYVKFD